MKLKKRKIKYAAVFFICWLGFMVLLVDGILGFQTLADYFGSYVLTEIMIAIGHSAYMGCFYIHKRE